MKKLKLIKAWSYEGTEYAVGTVLDMEDAELAKKLLTDGFAKEVEAAAVEPDAGDVDDGKKAAKSSPVTSDPVVTLTADQLEKMLDRVVTKTAGSPARPRINVVKERVEDDKTCGYSVFGERAFGKYLQDIVAQGTHKIEPEAENRLNTSHKVATSLFTKAVGSDELATLEGSLGDFLIPPQFSTTIMMEQLEKDMVRPYCTHVPVTGKSLTIPSQVDRDHSTGQVHGGVQVFRTIERKQLASSKPDFEQIELKPKRLTGLCFLTEDLMMHVASLGGLIGSMFSDAITFYEFGNWLNGKGGADPVGVLNADATITISAETGQASTEILPDNIRKMRARCYGYAQAVWTANYDVYPALSAMQERIGTAGQLVWQPSLVEDRPDMLMGRPIFFTEQCETVGTKGDLILNSWSRYLIGERAETKVDSSIHLRFDYHEMALRFIKWNDGQPWWRSALTPRKGANTLSPFVNLATRT